MSAAYPPLPGATTPRYRGQPRRAGRLLGWIPLSSPEELFTFPLFTAMLFVAQFGSAAGLVMMLWPLGCLALRRRDFVPVLSRQWPLLLLPAYMVLSTIWSEAPDLTIRYSLEYVLTVMAGIAIGVSRDTGRSLQGICAAFGLYLVVAFAFGHTVGVGGGGGGRAFSGLTESKNLLSDMSATGLIISLSTVIAALAARRWLWAVAALGCAGLDGVVVGLTRSAGAVVAIVPALAALVVLLLACALRPGVRAGLVALVAVSLGVVAAVLEPILAWMFSTGAALFDKDPTLTGRTYLWYRAGELIDQRPLLGRGLYAFWRQGNLDAEGMWQYGGITSRAGFNFHNAAVQILVDLGWIGLVLFVGVVLLGLVLAIRRFVVRPSPWTVFSLAWMAYALARTPFEVFGIAPFYYSTVLLYAVLANALAPIPAIVRARVPYPVPAGPAPVRHRRSRRPVTVIGVETVPPQPAPRPQ